MSKTPTILKKDDSQRTSRVSTQPKILTKASVSVKENVPIVNIKKVEEGPLPLKLMKRYHRLMSNFQLDTKFLDFIDSENR
jgi:hypothetical protein